MIADDVVRHLVAAQNIRTDLFVPNVSWGLVSWGECDVLKMSKSGYLTEYEVKVSASDIKREWTKKRWNSPRHVQSFRTLIRAYYMAVPAGLVDVVKSTMPDWVGGGIVSVSPIDDGSGLHRSKNVRWIKDAKKNTTARSLTPAEQYQLARLGSMRYWSRFMKEVAA